jgi:hypothetical protein
MVLMRHVARIGGDRKNLSTASVGKPDGKNLSTASVGKPEGKNLITASVGKPEGKKFLSSLGCRWEKVLKFIKV